MHAGAVRIGTHALAAEPQFVEFTAAQSTRYQPGHVEIAGAATRGADHTDAVVEPEGISKKSCDNFASCVNNWL